MKNPNFSSLYFKRDQIKIIVITPNSEKLSHTYFSIKTKSGKFILINNDTQEYSELPMDQNIYIKSINIKEGKMDVIFKAKVMV